MNRGFIHREIKKIVEYLGDFKVATDLYCLVVLIVRGHVLVIWVIIPFMNTSNEKNILLKFGSSLQYLRKERGISQEQLANIAGLDRSYVGGVERGERNISLINILKIANALEVSLESLFKDIDG